MRDNFKFGRNSKRQSVLACWLIGIILLAVTLENCKSMTPQNPPVFHFVDKEISLGKIRHSSLAVAVFELINDGEKPIRIERFSRVCKCIKVRCDDAEILPSDTAKIIVEYNKQMNGYFDQSFIVYIEGDTDSNLLIVNGIVE